MFTISRKIEIDAGHRVPYHHSKCRYLHGHRWTIVAHVAGEALVAADPARSDSGMILDFGVIKRVLMELIHDRFDHRMMLWSGDPLLSGPKPRQYPYLDRFLGEFGLGDCIRIVPCIPTAEGLAEYWAGLLKDPLSAERFQLVALEVRETPNSTVVYRPHIPTNLDPGAICS